VTEYDNTNKGVLFRNDRKESDNHPDYRGQININGREFWLSAWIKTGQKGKFMSLSAKPKDDQPQREVPMSQRAPAKTRQPMQKQSIIPDDDMDGDRIPF